MVPVHIEPLPRHIPDPQGTCSSVKEITKENAKYQICFIFQQRKNWVPKVSGGMLLFAWPLEKPSKLYVTAALQFAKDQGRTLPDGILYIEMKDNAVYIDIWCDIPYIW